MGPVEDMVTGRKPVADVVVTVVGRTVGVSGTDAAYATVADGADATSGSSMLPRPDDVQGNATTADAVGALEESVNASARGGADGAEDTTATVVGIACCGG